MNWEPEIPSLNDIRVSNMQEFTPVLREENSTIKQPKRSGPPKTQVDHLVNSFRKLSFPQKQQFLSKIKIYL